MGISQVPAPTSSSLPTWVELANNQTSVSTGGVTFSGLSGYNYYRIVVSSFYPSGLTELRLRINGLTTSIYQFRSFQSYNGATTFATNNSTGLESFIRLSSGIANNLGTAWHSNCTIDFWNANSSSVFKNLTYTMDSSASFGSVISLVEGAATARTSNTISSITLLTSGNSISYDTTAGGVALYGAN